jgi:hypothetical protein
MPTSGEFTDPKAKYVGRPIASPDGFVGNHLFVQTCECCPEDLFLVEVSDIEYYCSRDGFAYLARLGGKVVWGDVPWKGVNIDRRQAYEEAGWQPLKKFNDYFMGMPGTEYQFFVDRLRYKVLKANGYRLISPVKMSGTDTIFGVPISESVDTKTPGSCSHHSVERCTGWFCAESCRKVRSEDGEILDDCDCPEGVLSGCIWMTWHWCSDNGCSYPKRCRKRFGLFGITCECK